MIRPVIQFPDPILLQKCAPIDIDAPPEQRAEARRLAGDLLDTMRKHHLFGLSAPQIGAPARVIAINQRTGCPFAIMVNPVITQTEGGVVESTEGCQSIDNGGPRFEVKRSKIIVVKFFDRADQEHEEAFQEMASIVIQHEIDHLDGILLPHRVAQDRGIAIATGTG